MKQLTDTQRAVIDYMRVFLAENDQLPTCQAISRAFGWASSNSASEHVQALARAGVIEKNELGKYRFVRGTQAAASPADGCAGPSLLCLPVRQQGARR